MRFRFELIAAAVYPIAGLLSTAAIAAASRQAAPPGSFAEMLDLRSVCRLKPWRTLQASGYDRGGGYFDSGNFLRIESNNHYVLMEADGPGCIDRMWFTYKSQIGGEPYDLLIFLDDRSRPVIEVDLDEIFTGSHHPFITPLAGLCGDSKYPGRYSYVPIAFQEFCKVVLVPMAPKEQYKYRLNSFGRQIPHIYYQITYRKFQPDTSVKRFAWDPSQSESEALAKVRSLWSNCGRSPWGDIAQVRQSTVKTVLNPGARDSLFELDGPAVIYEIQLRVDKPEGIWVEMLWDGSKNPQVSAPIGPFFACADSGRPSQDVAGLWTGFADGAYYCYLPMPFRRKAKIAVRSEAKTSASIEAKIRYRLEEVLNSDAVFCTHRYDYPSPPLGRDYCVADLKGAGQFVGLVMDRPGHMEGDDSFFIDGEKQPSIHGTGTEDYFNFAWGLSHTGTLALHGITIQGNSPICYRMDIPWAVPFRDSLLITWEHGHNANEVPNLDTKRYSGVAFYYRSDYN
ncbi:MAG: DUF2961 domain-containing protein [Sedimentisphaerales bacterium]|nr:DUF2961 domain-containing protein [Sedimentisphaerales bacterium]